MIEHLTDFPDDVVGFACKGHVTRADYDSVLIPAVEAAFETHGKLRLYYQVDADFAGVAPGAAWEDFREGMRHLTRWERIAVVTDVEWIGHTIRTFGFLMPGKVRIFPLAEQEAARAWITAPADASAGPS